MLSSLDRTQHADAMVQTWLDNYGRHVRHGLVFALPEQIVCEWGIRQWYRKEAADRGYAVTTHRAEA